MKKILTFLMAEFASWIAPENRYGPAYDGKPDVEETLPELTESDLKMYEHSDIAIREGIDNKVSSQPNASAIRERIRWLHHCIYVPVKKRFPGMHISSGFRSPELNKHVGSRPYSQHVRGEALDIKYEPGHNSLKKEHDWVKDNLDFDQLIWEKKDSGVQWLHISFVKNRNKCFKLFK